MNESAGVVSLLDTWPAFSSFIYPSLGLESPVANSIQIQKTPIFRRSEVWADRAEIDTSERKKKIFPPEASRAIVSGFVEPVRAISAPSLSGWTAETPPKRKEFASCELTGASIVYGIRNVELILN